MSLHPLWSHFPDICSELEKVSELIGNVVTDSPEPIRNDLSRLLTSTGKMLRPAFVILSSSWGTEKTGGLYAVAASVELLHVATLIHDDILDDAPRRRGVETLHRTMGVKKAVLTGDYLMGIAFKLAAGKYDESLVSKMMDGINRICLSEMDQDFQDGGLNISKEVYFQRIRGKTAELFGMSCYAGAALGQCENGLRERLYELGILFGMAFQIEDDVLDYTGKKGILGKDTGKDLKAGIPTLPLIEALDDQDRMAENYVRFPFLRLGSSGLQKRIVRKGYAAKAEKAAWEYKRQAMDLLDQLPETPSIPVFKELFSLLQARES